LGATNDFQSIRSVEDSITLITGPESGFSKKEREFLNAATSHNISLGKNILRAETAPITALSVIKSNLGLL
jgi:RNA methyltransferase, RsmE family